MLRSGSNAFTDNAFISRVQVERKPSTGCYLSSLGVKANVPPGKVPHNIWTPHVLVQIYSLAALHNSQGILPRIHQGTSLVVMQASSQLVVCGVELQRIIAQVQCSHKVGLVQCLYAKLQHIPCTLLCTAWKWVSGQWQKRPQSTILCNMLELRSTSRTLGGLCTTGHSLLCRKGDLFDSFLHARIWCMCVCNGCSTMLFSHTQQ